MSDTLMIEEDAKPFSQACLNNRQPILAVLRRVFAQSAGVLEIGSGTGQHAVYFASELSHLRWQTSDLPENLPGISLWLNEALQDAPSANLPDPVALNVLHEWPKLEVDAVFSANTAHIMSWPAVQAMFAGVAERLPVNGVFALYGPFNYDGDYTSDSNARFDSWLKADNPDRAIRDFEKVDGAARQVGLTLLEDNAMPANNRLLVWQKLPGQQAREPGENQSGSLDDAIIEYSKARQHPANRFCHTLGIPMVLVSIIGLLLSLIVPQLWKPSLALLVLGAVLQFIGHGFEGKPPAFFKGWRFLPVGVRWWWAKLRGKI